MSNTSGATYSPGICDLRQLLAKIGHSEFKAYGYAAQIRRYRAALRSQVAA